MGTWKLFRWHSDDVSFVKTYIAVHNSGYVNLRRIKSVSGPDSLPEIKEDHSNSNWSCFLFPLYTSCLPILFSDWIKFTRSYLLILFLFVYFLVFQETFHSHLSLFPYFRFLFSFRILASEIFRHFFCYISCLCFFEFCSSVNSKWHEIFVKQNVELNTYKSLGRQLDTHSYEKMPTHILVHKRRHV